MATVNPLSGKSKLAVANSTAFINIYEGSVRSGKTVATLIDWIRYCRTAPPGNLLMTGRTERTIINNLVIPIQEMLGKSRVTINRGNGTVNICGREVMLVGANNEQARTKIQGLTLAGAYVDEASTLPESYWNMLTTRLSEDGARMWATCNPEGPRHWFKVKWLDKAKLWVKHDGTIEDHTAEFERQDDDPDIAREDLPLSDLHRFSFTLEDNRANLSPKYYRNVMSMYTGLWFKRMILGEWTMADGVIYEMFDPAKHVVNKLPAMERILSIGIDDGVQHPAAGILLGLGVDNRLYAVAEWAPPSGTPADRTKHLRKWLQERDGQEPEYHFVDPSAAALKLQLNRDGFQNVYNAANKHSTGIGLVASLLSTGDLLIYAPDCPNLLGEIPGYVWDKKAAEKGIDAPIKLDDDFCDALRYAVATARPMWQPYLPNLHAATRLPDDRIEDAA